MQQQMDSLSLRQAELAALQAQETSQHAWRDVLDVLGGAAAAVPLPKENAALDVTLRTLSDALEEACARLKTPMHNGTAHADSVVPVGSGKLLYDPT